ncbi:MAG: LD-carboxypeptidase [Erysipelotrichaceae bacterium]|nr:LD-carboxypeptidase [Erysipelotrichaceae bacterium]
MIYPKFIKKNDTIGICAPSAGMGDRLESLDESIKTIKKCGYKVKETKSVRNCGARSTSGKNRAKEIDELITDKNVKVVSCATGGDYMLEILPYINFDHIKDNPKWILGMSDPTNLLYTVTTKLDIATMYGHNGAGYTLDLNRSKKQNLDYLKGDIKIQKSYKKYQNFIDTCNDIKILDKDVKWISKKDVDVTGRLIGGCLEVIEKIIGTEYDYTKEFLEKYKDDGIIWYFDVFNMSSYSFYLTMLQFKYAGFFKYCKAILIGRVAFPTIEDPKFDYIKAADLALKNIPHICEMDIGHTKPGMTLINGAICNVKYHDGKGSISFKLR